MYASIHNRALSSSSRSFSRHCSSRAWYSTSSLSRGVRRLLVPPWTPTVKVTLFPSDSSFLATSKTRSCSCVIAVICCARTADSRSLVTPRTQPIIAAITTGTSRSIQSIPRARGRASVPDRHRACEAYHGWGQIEGNGGGTPRNSRAGRAPRRAGGALDRGARGARRDVVRAMELAPAASTTVRRAASPVPARQILCPSVHQPAGRAVAVAAGRGRRRRF